MPIWPKTLTTSRKTAMNRPRSLISTVQTAPYLFRELERRAGSVRLAVLAASAGRVAEADAVVVDVDRVRVLVHLRAAAISS
jgi:hypothetical protein